MNKIEREGHLFALSPLRSQVCEDGGTLDGLNIKGLAALTADAVVGEIHSRLAERPAGERRILAFF